MHVKDVMTRHVQVCTPDTNLGAAGNLYACNPQEDVREALKLMRTEKVRRLPVISANGTLQGIISINDVVLHADDEVGVTRSELCYEDVVHTLKDICARRMPAAA